MKCPICNKEFSTAVYPHHYNWCKEQVEEVKEIDYKELAKRNDIPNYWLKKEETLIEELKELGVI